MFNTYALLMTFAQHLACHRGPTMSIAQRDRNGYKGCHVLDNASRSRQGREGMRYHWLTEMAMDDEMSNAQFLHGILHYEVEDLDGLQE